ncbi:hypothetical protein Dimus_007958, partial [Dionaea muscipula]
VLLIGDKPTRCPHKGTMTAMLPLHGRGTSHAYRVAGCAWRVMWEPAGHAWEYWLHEGGPWPGRGVPPLAACTAGRAPCWPLAVSSAGRVPSFPHGVHA